MAERQFTSTGLRWLKRPVHATLLGLRGAITIAAMTLAGCSGGDDAPEPPTGNVAPSFTSATAATTDENATGAVYTAAASDANGDAISFSITGGDDAALFNITSNGDVSFVTPPNFEAPTDSDTDNTYLVIISASDGAASSTLPLSITVNDVGEGISVRRIISGLDQPLFLLDRGDSSGRLFVVEKPGQVEVLDPATGILEPTPFLDTVSSISSDSERGLLGMALAPDFATSGIFYVHVTNLAGNTEIRRYTVSASDPDAADPASMDIILTVNQPASNHNGGWIGFGPDGFLYIALGDGGGGNDPFNQGQDPNTLLAAILRIDVSADEFPGDPTRDYRIPTDNPFSTGGGAPEVLAYGLRNPFRCGFDRDTGDLYIGDVGQGAIEEISLIPAGTGGQNFGWPILEGTRVNQAGATTGFSPPVAEYPHDGTDRGGFSVTGGVVYRGPVEDLQGDYLFADFVSDNIWSIPAGSLTTGATVNASGFAILNDTLTPDLGAIGSVAAFGEDADGNVYIVDLGGEIFAIEEDN